MSSADYPGLELDGLRGEITRSIQSRPRLGYGLKHVGFALAQLSLALALVASLPRNSAWNLLAFVFVGFSQYRLFFPLHEACHNTLFLKPELNQWLGQFFSALLFTTFPSFSTIHIQHHRWVGEERDPGAIDYFVHFRSRREKLLFFVYPLFGLTALEKVKLYLLDPFLRRAHSDVLPSKEGIGSPGEDVPRATAREIALVLAVQFVVFLAISRLGARPLDYVLFYFIPAATLFPFLMRLRMYLEHGPLDYGTSDYLGENRRTIARTFTRTFAERPLFSFMNFRFHREHHIVPGISSEYLPEVHVRFVRDRLDPDDSCPRYLEALLKILRLG